MIRSASEMKAATEETIENEIMKQIQKMADQKSYEAIFSTSDIPDWLCEKLTSFGYLVVVDNSLDLLTVSWGQIQDAK